MLKSEFMNSTYERKVENFNKTIQDRVETVIEAKEQLADSAKKGIAAVFLPFIYFFYISAK